VPILEPEITRALTEPLLVHSDREGWLVDCTLGGGGHTSALLTALRSAGALGRIRILAIDQDAGAVARASDRFSEDIRTGHLELAHARFSELPRLADGRKVWGILADLGFSSDQIEDEARGLSFRQDGPLDMRMDPSHGVSASEWIRHAPESEIADVIYEYGEERGSRAIARAVVGARSVGQAPQTTAQLAEIVRRALRGGQGKGHGRQKIDPATRTFQAIRIHVNGELDELEALLNHGILKLEPGGRVAVIAFHSLEDRRVKRRFRPEGSSRRTREFAELTPKPMVAGSREVATNPRARSAKLRIAERR